ncbi:tektin-2 isoform X1 [Polypterus senegalus]|nr:tektin-2 isoform X1 [Polypterus senegalus]
MLPLRAKQLQSDLTLLKKMTMKPCQKFSVSDWNTNNQLLCNTAEKERAISHDVRQEARMLRNETFIQTKWDEQDTRTRLTNRSEDIRRWIDNLEKGLCDVNTEIEALKLVKDEAERAVAATSIPLEVSKECLTMRDGRRSNDLVRDPVEIQLQCEMETSGKAQQVLQKSVQQIFEQLCLLQEARQQLEFDLQNKKEALDIDMTCLNLELFSPEVSLKPNSTRVPSGSTTPQQWEQFSHYNLNRALEEVKASVHLREATMVSIAQASNELEAQRVAANFALRKREHELKRALDELLWQQKNTKTEVEEMEADVRALEEDLMAKMAPLKLAQTRLETRTYRPGADLCRDQAQYGLTDEVQQLERTRNELQQKLAQSQSTLNLLYTQFAHINDEIACKTHSLTLEKHVLGIRHHLSQSLEKSLPLTEDNHSMSEILTQFKNQHSDLE